MTRFRATPELGGTGRVADDLYLMAHHDSTGRPYIQPRAVGIGLAGALLAELMLAGQLSISSGGSLTPRGGRGGDWLVGRVLDQIVVEREARPAGEWLLFLSHSTADDVAQRLGEAGYLTRVPRPLWLGERWVPSDSDCAFMPMNRARAALDPSRPVTVQAAALTGLAAACGLESRLLDYAPPRSRRDPQDVGELLPYELRELIAQTQAVVDSAVLAQRL